MTDIGIILMWVGSCIACFGCGMIFQMERCNRANHPNIPEVFE